MKSSRIGKIATLILVLIILGLYWIQNSTTNYEVKGRVAGFSSNPFSVFIEHEAIPGYMNAMTMPFRVKDSTQIQNLEIGQAIEFKYYVNLGDEASYIDSIELIADSLVSKPGAIASDLGIQPVQTQNYIHSGDTLPNYSFIDQNGRELNTADLKGKKILFTFIYTNCPVPEYCPLMSFNFKEIYSELISRDTNFVLLSISFDVLRDNPETLRSYGSRYTKDFTHWKFLTGTKEQIEKVTSEFSVITQSEKNQIIHNLRTVYINEKGIVKKIWIDNKWQPADIIHYMDINK